MTTTAAAAAVSLRDRTPAGELREVARAGLMALPLLGGVAVGSAPLSLLGVAGALASALLVPRVGLLILVLVAPLLSKPLLPAPGFTFLMAAALLMGCVLRLPVERPRLRVDPVVLPIVGFVLYVFLQQLPGMLEGYGASEMARDVGSTFAKIAAAAGVALAAGLLLKDRSPAPYLLAVVVSATLAALLCIVSALSPEPPFPFANLIAGTLGSRPSGPFGNPNYFGQFAAFGLVLALGWAWVTRGGGRGRSWLLAACAGILAGGLLVAQSRGALLSVLIGVVAMGFARSRRTGVIITVVCLALGAALLPLLLEARMSSRAGFYGVLAADSQLASDSGRLDRILEGPQLFVSAPLFGVGLFQYILITGDYPHNWYMLILAEQGLVGIALWALILGWLVRRIRRAEQAPRLVGSGLLGTFLVGCLFLEPSTDGQGSIAPVVAFVAVVACRWPRARSGGERQARPAAAHPAAGAWPGLATSPAPGERPA